MAKKQPKQRDSIARIGAYAALAAVALLLIFSVGTVVLPEFSCSILDNPDKQYFIWIPKAVSDSFYGARVNLHFIMPYGNTLDVHGTVSDREISPIRCGSPYERDFTVSMTWREALALTGSNEPIRDFVKLWGNGKIIMDAKGVENQERLQAARARLVLEDGEPVPERIQRSFDKYRANSSK